MYFLAFAICWWWWIFFMVSIWRIVFNHYAAKPNVGNCGQEQQMQIDQLNWLSDVLFVYVTWHVTGIYTYIHTHVGHWQDHHQHQNFLMTVNHFLSSVSMNCIFDDFDEINHLYQISPWKPDTKLIWIEFLVFKVSEMIVSIVCNIHPIYWQMCQCCWCTLYYTMLFRKRERERITLKIISNQTISSRIFDNKSGN